MPILIVATNCAQPITPSQCEPGPHRSRDRVAISGHARSHAAAHGGEVERARDDAESGLPNPSFTHLIHLYSTQNDGLQSEAANRLVPCKHKEIRGFSETFGNDKIKARTQSVAGSNALGPDPSCRGGAQVPSSGTARIGASKKSHLERRETLRDETSYQDAPGLRNCVGRAASTRRAWCFRFLRRGRPSTHEPKCGTRVPGQLLPVRVRSQQSGQSPCAIGEGAGCGLRLFQSRSR